MHDSHLEAEIILTAQTDKRKAFSLAFDAFWEMVYQQAYRKLQSEQIAEDVTQETFIVLWENFEKLAYHDRVVPFLLAVLRNKVFKLYESDQVRLKYIVAQQKNDELHGVSPDQELVNKELGGMIDQELNKMPLRMKEIYDLKKEEEYSVKEIAEQLHLSEQTVKNQLHNAYGRLRKFAEAYYTSFIVIYIYFYLFRH